MIDAPLTVTLRADSPYHHLFPGGRAPVRTLEPQVLRIGGQFEPCYMLDADRLDSGICKTLACCVAANFGARVDDVRAELLVVGLPIRASQVAVPPSIDLRFIQ